MKKSVFVAALALVVMGWGPGVAFGQLGGKSGSLSAKEMVAKGKAALKAEKLKAAFQWFLKAARMENPEAQDMVGNCYENGIGVLGNDSDAAVWYEKSAGYGYPNGLNDLGNCYIHGTGVARDNQVAIRYYHMAATKGSAAAIYNLGYCYENGFGFPMSLGMAKYYYRMAAAKGYTLAESRLRQIGK